MDKDDDAEENIIKMCYILFNVENHKRKVEYAKYIIELINEYTKKRDVT